MNFRASTLSLTARLITAVFLGVLFIIVLLIIINNPNALLSVKLIGVFIFVFIPLIIYIFSPVGYKLTESDLIIKRKIREIKIPLSKIEEVRRIAKEDFFRGFARGGVGGVFGFFGKIFSWNIGNYYAYFTNENNAIFIKADRIIVISPDEPDLFIKIISGIIQESE